jgi:hypothetical protein
MMDLGPVTTLLVLVGTIALIPALMLAGQVAHWWRYSLTAFRLRVALRSFDRRGRHR